MSSKPNPIGWASSLTALARVPREMYESVMVIEKSPLKKLDPMVAHMVFQILAFIWSGIFAAMIGSYMAFGVSSFLHICFIAGVFITFTTFRAADKSPQSFNLRPGYHSVSRTRQVMWINGEKVLLDEKDPGGEHE